MNIKKQTENINKFEFLHMKIHIKTHKIHIKTQLHHKKLKSNFYSSLYGTSKNGEINFKYSKKSWEKKRRYLETP